MSMKDTRAEAKGAAKKAAKAIKGQLGIYTTLAEEHGKVSSLMNQLISADIAEREERFAEIRKELIAHAKAEEEQFYSVLLNYPESRDMAQHSIEEHGEIERLLDELARKDSSTEVWLGEFRKLRQRVEHHADEEESELFPLAEKVLDRDHERQMDEQFSREKQRQMGAVAPPAE